MPLLFPVGSYIKRAITRVVSTQCAAKFSSSRSAIEQQMPVNVSLQKDEINPQCELVVLHVRVRKGVAGSLDELSTDMSCVGTLQLGKTTDTLLEA